VRLYSEVMFDITQFNGKYLMEVAYKVHVMWRVIWMWCHNVFFGCLLTGCEPDIVWYEVISFVYHRAWLSDIICEIQRYHLRLYCDSVIWYGYYICSLTASIFWSYHIWYISCDVVYMYDASSQHTMRYKWYHMRSSGTISIIRDFTFGLCDVWDIMQYIMRRSIIRRYPDLISCSMRWYDLGSPAISRCNVW
jgi:hypothetical protein